MKKVSVVIPTYNYGQFIREALNSVLAQSLKPKEIIVVDDGSTDDTEEVVHRFGDGVRYIRQENAGVCSARNRGVAESSGEFIAFLDADDYWEPTKIEKQLAKFAAPTRSPDHPADDASAPLLKPGEELTDEIGLVHCGMREFDSETGETIKIHLDGDEGWVAKDIALWERPVVIGPGGSIMVRRKVFDEVGGFDERLKNGEDWEFCFRVAQKYKIGFVREPLVNYRNHGSNATKNVREMERSTLLAWDKVFSTDDAKIRALRRRSYGNLHKVLAGSYLHKGEYGGFLRNLLKSLWYRPSYLGYYLTLPARRRKN